MTSEMAKEDIRNMMNEGLSPTVEDIIRLNGMAVKFENAKSKNSCHSLYSLPRVAMIGEGIYFRQPSLGHELFISKAERHFDMNDFQTVLCLNAYVLSRELDELPDPNNIEKVKGEIQDFQKKIQNYTRDQIFAAIDYVKNDVREETGEYAPKKENGEDCDWLECVAVGVLYEAKVILLGMSERDILKHPLSKVRAMMDIAFRLQAKGSDREDANIELGEYLLTLDKIRERLKKEKENG